MIFRLLAAGLGKSRQVGTSNPDLQATGSWARQVQASLGKWEPAILIFTHAGDANMLLDIAALRRDEDIAVVLSKAGDYNPEAMPIVEWAVAIYVAGDLQKLTNTLALLDAWLNFRIAHPVAEDRSPWPAK